MTFMLTRWVGSTSIARTCGVRTTDVEPKSHIKVISFKGRTYLKNWWSKFHTDVHFCTQKLTFTIISCFTIKHSFESSIRGLQLRIRKVFVSFSECRVNENTSLVVSKRTGCSWCYVAGASGVISVKPEVKFRFNSWWLLTAIYQFGLEKP